MPEDLKTMSLKELSLKAPKSTDKNNKAPSSLGNKKQNSQSMPQGLDSTGSTVPVIAPTYIGSLDDLSREPLSDDSEDEMVLWDLNGTPRAFQLYIRIDGNKWFSMTHAHIITITWNRYYYCFYHEHNE